jgi:hypothetical protein
VTTYTNDPNHWSNRYPWNRKGTAIRLALEQFLTILERHPEADQDQRREALAWLKGLLDKKPGELFP